MSTEKAIRRGSAKEIGLDIKILRNEAESEPGVEIQVMRVIGKISNFETGEGTNGAWIKFIGYFRYFNLLTGEIFRTTRAHLPVGDNEVLAQFKANKEAAIQNDAAVSELVIGFDYSVKDNDFGVGYIFSAESIIPDDNTSVDPLENVMKGMKALPAPKTKTATKKQKAAATA